MNRKEPEIRKTGWLEWVKLLLYAFVVLLSKLPGFGDGLELRGATWA